MAMEIKAEEAAGSVSKSYLAQGNEAFRIGEYKKAKDLFNKSLKQNPDLATLINFNISLVDKRIGDNPERNKEKSSVESIEKPKETVAQVENIKGKIPFKNISDYDGRLERFENGSIRGWAIEKNVKNGIFELSVLVDGVLFSKIKNHDSRADLKRAGKSNGKGGYSLSIPDDILDSDKHVLTVLYPNGETLASLEIKGVNKNKSNDVTLLPVEESFSVIVPIYNAVEDVKVCIERLVSYTSKDVDVILIDDASPDKAIRPILEKASEYANFRIFHNNENLGFTKTVNRGIELAGTNDVVLLNSDARVTPRWLEGFKRALATDHKIATVTAMSDRAGAFSAPSIGNDNNLPEGVSEEDYAVAFRRRSVGYYPTVPTGNGFCMYIRRSCINEIGALDAEAFPRGYGEENDFCMRARAHGWRNVIDDRTYVFHDRSKSFGGQKSELIKAGRAVVDSRYPDYKKATEVFSSSPLINLARFKAKMAALDSQNNILPRGLFVISTLTGGTPQTNRDLMLSLDGKVEGWLLHCDRKVITLSKVVKYKPDQVVRQHVLKEPVDALTHYCSEYDRVVSNWLSEYDFEFVHVRHLAWHSLALLKIAKLCGARVINSFHDFYALCPTVKLLDGDNNYCGGVCTKNSSKSCKPDLWGGDSMPFLKNSWVTVWKEKFNEALKYCDAFITTHESVRETILKHLDLDESRFYVIPHGRDFDDLYQLSMPYQKDEALRILVPGNISITKGSEIIQHLLEKDVDEKLHFHILGRTNINYTHPRLTFHGEYKRDDFATHVMRIRPHVGAVFSIWNETWCHTLTELWSCGLPVIATNYPTISQRINESGAGWCFEHADVTTLYKSIISLMDSDVISRKRSACLEYQKSMVSHNTYAMSISYRKHYGV